MHEGYEGWEIEIYRRTPIEHFIFELKICFNTDGYSFSKDTYDMTCSILYGPTREDIQVIFPEQLHGSYEVTLHSTVFGIKTKDERAHRKLFWKTWERIPWRKKGFWLQNGVRVPIHRCRPLLRK